MARLTFKFVALAMLILCSVLQPEQAWAQTACTTSAKGSDNTAGTTNTRYVRVGTASDQAGGNGCVATDTTSYSSISSNTQDFKLYLPAPTGTSQANGATDPVVINVENGATPNVDQVVTEISCPGGTVGGRGTVRGTILLSPGNSCTLHVYWENGGTPISFSGGTLTNNGGDYEYDGGGVINGEDFGGVAIAIVVTKTTAATSAADQQEAASNLIQNRNNTLLNIQPDISGFIDGTFADGGGPLGNFGLGGNDAGFNMSFASSMGKVWSEMARNQSLANRRSAAARTDNARNLHLQSSAFLYGQLVPEQADSVTQTSASTARPKTGGTDTLELESKENPYGSTTVAENTSPLSQTQQRGYDMWVQVNGAKAHAGDSDSTIWVGYAGGHKFINDNLLIGGMVQLDWADESNDTDGSSADGFGWMFGPYLAAKLPHQNLFFDARAAYGRSDNDITLTTSTGSFETERWLVSAKVSGLLQEGDIDIRPAVSATYFEETQNSYTDSTNTVIGSQTFTQGEIRFGPTFSQAMQGDNGTVIRPRIGVDGVWNFAVNNGASSQGAVLGTGDLRARINFGITVVDAQAWNIDLSGFYDGIGIDNYYAYGGKARLTVPLQ